MVCSSSETRKTWGPLGCFLRGPFSFGLVRFGSLHISSPLGVDYVRRMDQRSRFLDQERLNGAAPLLSILGDAHENLTTPLIGGSNQQGDSFAFRSLHPTFAQKLRIQKNNQFTNLLSKRNHFPRASERSPPSVDQFTPAPTG